MLIILSPESLYSTRPPLIIATNLVIGTAAPNEVHITTL